ncbi:MAG: S-layer homology domain-containing protein, partial [Dehalobacterium sp.]
CDVKNGQWYTDAIIWADANGIVTGLGGGLFGVSDNVTREQLATILYNYAKYKGRDTAKAADLKAFTDASGISGWAQAAMKWANAEGLVTGVTATTLVPSGSATRAQVATILMRLAEGVAK